MYLDNKPVFLMLVGVPGCGKTTFSNTLEDNGMLSLSSDAIIDNLAYTLGKSYGDIFKQVIDHATKRFEADLSMSSFCQMPLIADRTNLTANSRRRVLNLLQNRDSYNKIAITFNTPLDVIKQRLTERNKTGKVISEELLETMLKSYEVPHVSEGFDSVMSADVFNLLR